MGFISYYAKAQILRVTTSPTAITSQIPAYNEVSTISTKTFSYIPSIPAVNPAPIDEDSTTEDDKLYRYADNITVSINTSDGNITTTSVGKVWTVRISIPNALNIGFMFDQFNLSPSAEMYIFNETRTVLDSGVMKAHFTYSTSVGIAPFKGNSVIIYIVEPNNFGVFQSAISIQKLEAGFQDFQDVGEVGNNQAFRTTSINCNPLIQCQQAKIPYARAVARFFSNGFQGTGTLINNENNNGRAYFLTAFHVLDVNRDIFGEVIGNGVLDPDEIAALTNARFQFQIWRTNCNGTTISRGIEFGGAVVRAAWPNTDVVMLELLNQPGIGDLVNYAGWNRQTTAPADYTSFIIHHPEGEDMRITSGRKVKSWFWNNDFWTAHYSSGTVTFGSSGSALMNENGQIIGQLRSGWSSCNFTDFGDRYGKLNSSWSGGGNDNNRLSNWLSPSQGAQATNLLNLTDIPINGPNLIACTTPSQYVTLPGLLDVTYEWTVSAGLQIISGQGTSTVTISGLPGNNYGSGTLTLILRSPTKGRIRFYTTSKDITISTGGNGSITGTYNSPTNSTEPLIPRPPKTLNPPVNAACIAFSTNMAIPPGSTVDWYGTTSSPDIIWYQTGKDIFCNFTAVNQTADLKISVTNVCGTSSASYRFECTTTNSCGITPLRVILSPNPASSNLRVSLEEKTGKSTQKTIREIRIIDKMGNAKQTLKYAGGVKTISVNVSLLIPDVYTIRIFDGESWLTEKFIKN